MASTKKRDAENVLRLCELMALRREILAEDIAALERARSGDAELSFGEAQALLALARGGFPACRQWPEYFAENLSGWFVDIHARADVRDEDARQLIRWLGGEDARLDAARFRFLMRVLERATHCSEELLAFARAALMRAMGVENPAPRAGSHRSTGQIQPPERTQNWIKVAGKVSGNDFGK